MMWLRTLLLLGLVGRLLDECSGHSSEDEDYYMQELLSREHYQRVLEDRAVGKETKPRPAASRPAGGSDPASAKSGSKKSEKNKKAAKGLSAVDGVFPERDDCPPLGLETLKIDDFQLHASSMRHYGLGPHRGRLNIQGGLYEDDLYDGGWCAGRNDPLQWFEVDARRLMKFTGVVTQGRSSLWS
ncbi:inactive carboxypeptidase-like protein X2 isoform X1 [Sinocyclocheilus grahami]|uniref:inactive carboxypeptidase-like protein X2 isoform X1 n=1 Tax=Sinocyclocheilus grahami TaxID=75366 RepID=UPI0007AC56BE|nr:PREDICTED: inactive carboxypeptidase-like protein X2 isoform X1 [Sinocyclocheilus grahami]